MMSGARISDTIGQTNDDSPTNGTQHDIFHFSLQPANAFIGTQVEGSPSKRTTIINHSQDTNPEEDNLTEE